MSAAAAVLCIDDEPQILYTMELILRGAGYEVLTARTMLDAFRAISRQQVDLVLLDCLPDRGWFAEEARRMNPKVRLVLCTGDLEQGPAPFVDGVLYKPVGPPELLRTISALLAS